MGENLNPHHYAYCSKVVDIICTLEEVSELDNILNSMG